MLLLYSIIPNSKCKHYFLLFYFYWSRCKVSWQIIFVQCSYFYWNICLDVQTNINSVVILAMFVYMELSFLCTLWQSYPLFDLNIEHIIYLCSFWRFCLLLEIVSFITFSNHLLRLAGYMGQHEPVKIVINIVPLRSKLNYEILVSWTRTGQKCLFQSLKCAINLLLILLSKFPKAYLQFWKKFYYLQPAKW